MIAHETIHVMNNKIKGKVGWIAAKLDMSKAYDRVEWCYLKGIMLKLRFARRWVYMIICCVKSVSYSIMVNGRPSGYITPIRGLR